MEASRWTLTKHWPVVGTAELRYPSVTIEGEDSFSGEYFAVVIWYDLAERGVAIKGISTVGPRDPGGVALRHEPPEAVTPSLLRDIPLDTIRVSIQESLLSDTDLLTPVSLWAKIHEEQGATATEEELKFYRAARQASAAAVADARRSTRTARPKRGRGAINDDFYADIATHYLDFHSRYGQTCVKELAAHLDIKPPQKVSEWVRRARELGWLSKAPGRGLAGGSAGIRLMQWLEEHEEET